MLSTVAPGFHMWATFAFIVVLIALYVGERLSIEVSSDLSGWTPLLFYGNCPAPAASTFCIRTKSFDY